MAGGGQQADGKDVDRALARQQRGRGERAGGGPEAAAFAPESRHLLHTTDHTAYPNLTGEENVSHRAWNLATAPYCPWCRQGSCRLRAHGTYARNRPVGATFPVREERQDSQPAACLPGLARERCAGTEPTLEGFERQLPRWPSSSCSSCAPSAPTCSRRSSASSSTAARRPAPSVPAPLAPARLRSKIEPLAQFAETLERHRTLVLNWFRTGRCHSSGAVEGPTFKPNWHSEKPTGSVPKRHSNSLCIAHLRSFRSPTLPIDSAEEPTFFLPIDTRQPASVISGDWWKGTCGRRDTRHRENTDGLTASPRSAMLTVVKCSSVAQW